MKLRPSGRNSRRRFLGSLQEGIDALSSAFHTKSFSCWWRARRPVPSLHVRPWVTMQSTHAPQLQVCSEQRGVLSCKPIATRMTSSSRRSPHEETGSACSQSPLCGDATAISRAQSRSFDAFSKRILDACLIEARSQLLWRGTTSGNGSAAEYLSVQTCTMCAIHGSSSTVVNCSILDRRSLVSTAEGQKDRGCQQGGASDPESSIAHWEAWLYPVNIGNADVNDTREARPEKSVECSNSGWSDHGEVRSV